MKPSYVSQEIARGILIQFSSAQLELFRDIAEEIIRYRERIVPTTEETERELYSASDGTCVWCGEEIVDGDKIYMPGPMHFDCHLDDVGMEKLRSAERRDDYGIIPY
jgi:hypothetical protein